MPLDVRTMDGSVTFSVHVQPGAKREEVLVSDGDAVKIALAAPAVDGKANDVLLRYLADLLNVPRLSVDVVTGHASRSKAIRVLGITAEQLEAKLMPTEAV